MENNPPKTPIPPLPEDLSFCIDGIRILSSSDDDSNPSTPLAPSPPSAPRRPIGGSTPAASGSTGPVDPPHRFLLPRPSRLLQEMSRISGSPGFSCPNASSSTPLAPPLTTPTSRQSVWKPSSASPSTVELPGSALLAASSSALRERSNAFNDGFGIAGGSPGASTSLVPPTPNSTNYRREGSSSRHGPDGFNNDFVFHASYPISYGNYSPELARRKAIDAQRTATIYHLVSTGKSMPEVRDAMLKERIRDLVLRRGVSLALATSERESKHLCSLLDEGDEEMRRNIVTGILPSLVLLMGDGSGSRLFDKLLHVCRDDEHRRIVTTLAVDPMRLHNVAKKSCGVSSIKKLIEAVKEHNVLIHHLTTALSFKILDLMIHGTASSLVDYCFNHLTYEQNMFLFEAAVRYCSELATAEDKGCFSLELCINFSKGRQRYEILKEVVKNTTRFSEDTCGNYVIQCVVDLEEPEATERICKQVARNIKTLSTHRIASYVVQKCLQSSAGFFLILSLVELEDEEFNMIIRDAYGNYVIQTALDCKFSCLPQHRHIYHRLASRIRHVPKTLWSDRHARNVIKHFANLDNRRHSRIGDGSQ